MQVSRVIQRFKLKAKCFLQPDNESRMFSIFKIIVSRFFFALQLIDVYVKCAVEQFFNVQLHNCASTCLFIFLQSIKYNKL